MDPHSRFSPFNSRQTKAGPVPSSTRSMEQSLKTTNPLETYKKRNTTQRRGSASSVTSLTGSRPIATNSRVKQDEQYRKDMYLAFINNALQQKLKGITDAFDELVDQFNSKQFSGDTPTSPSQLRIWLTALSHVVSRLERAHAPLLEAIVGMPWTTMDLAFVKSYVSFIGMLVSAKPEYLNMVLGMVASGLTYQSGLQALNVGIPESSSSPLTRRIVYDRIHYLSQHLLSLVPTLPSTLQPLLVRNFPHKRQNQASQVTYIRNLLRITEYCPELSDRIFATIVDRAIQIDVEIQVELEELEEQAGEDQTEIFDLDPFDTVVGQEGESDSEDGSDIGDAFSDLSSEADGELDDSDDPQPEELTNFQHVQDMVNKLDAILKNVFDHFAHIRVPSELPLQTPSTPTLQSTLDSSSFVSLSNPLMLPTEAETKAIHRTQFYTLLSIFDRTILRTFKSRYTQFLIFWYSSLDPEFSDLFQGMLVSKALLEEDQPAVTRAAAASYIASFVSRAEFVGRESTRQAVACLCNFLANRLSILDAVTQSGAQPPSLSQHTVFYAVTQAVFLIFCFRWRDLQHEPEDTDELGSVTVPASKWMPELSVLKKVVQSELNPLKVCASNVVMQFARVAHATDFLYCYSIIEANRRMDFSSRSSSNGSMPTLPQSNSSFISPALLGHTMHSELNTFFPFDPYRLPRSGSYIQGVYREWSSVAIDDEEDSDSDSDNEDEGEGIEDMSSATSHEVEKSEPLLVGIPIGTPHLETEDSTDGLGASFGGMSISPAQPTLSISVGIPMSVS